VGVRYITPENNGYSTSVSLFSISRARGAVRVLTLAWLALAAGGCGVTAGPAGVGGASDGDVLSARDQAASDGSDERDTSARRIQANPRGDSLGERWSFSIAGVPPEERDLYEFYWDFGDGASAVGDMVTHVFGMESVYEVSVRAVDADEHVRYLLTKTVLASWTSTDDPGGALVVLVEGELVYQPSVVVLRASTRVHGAVEGEEVEYEWTFADGASVTGSEVTRNISDPGPFQVSLTAQTSLGRTASYVRFFTVTDGPSSAVDGGDIPPAGAGENPDGAPGSADGEETAQDEETGEEEAEADADENYQPGGRVPQWPLKTSPTLFTAQQIDGARELCETDPGAQAIRTHSLHRASHWIAISDEELYQLLPDSSVPRAFNVSARGCPVHGKEIYLHGTYPWELDREDPFTVTCPIGGESYPSNDFAAYYAGQMQDESLLTGSYPDDGRGWASPDGEKFWMVAYACHWNWREHWLPAVKALARAYALSGEEIYARKAIVMLDRIASIYPEMNYSQQSRYSELIGGEYHGKILNSIWETTTLRDLAIAYDLVFDELIGEEPIALPWRNAQEIQANIEANLLEEGIEAVGLGHIRGNYGRHQSALAYTVVVRQHGPTGMWLDGIFRNTGGETASEGLDYALYNLVYKDGMPNETSPSYCSGWVDNVAWMAQALTRAGYGIYQHPKVAPLFDMPLNILCNAEFTPANGDSGSVASGTALPSTEAYEAAYRSLRRPGYAWTLERRGALSGTPYRSFEDLFEEPISEDAVLDAGLYQPQLPSRVFDGYGMAILNNADDSVAVSLYYGIRGKHGHYDRLNIELFGHGRRLAPDLGYPDFMNGFVPGIFSWSQNTISHNTVMVDESKQRGRLPGQVLRFHRSPMVSVVDVDAAGSYDQTTTYRRTLIAVDVADHDTYFVDVFRVRGGQNHVLSLHGQEGDFDLTGASLPPPVTQGTLAGPDVAYGELYDDPVLGQPGYQGTFNGYSGSGYSHLFNWQSVIPDATVTGHWGLSGAPAAHLRVHIAPHPGQELIVADAYVSPLQRIPTVLKYMLLRRTGGTAGNTFVTVWEPSTGQLIDQVVFDDDPALGTGSERVVVLSVHRGQAVDRIAVAPQAGMTYAMAPDITSDAAVAVVTVDSGQWARAYAAGGSHLTDAQTGQSLAVPPTIVGQITGVDYVGRTITADIGGASFDASTLAGDTVRISNGDHSAVYPIAAADRAGSLLMLSLTGSDVLTGRIKLQGVNASARTVATNTNIPHEFNLPGMHLVTDDLTHTERIVYMDDSQFQLVPGADLAPFAADLAAGKDAWIADFGMADQIEIERFVDQ
jgi:hypothetical protein